MSINKSAEVTPEIREQIEKEYDKISELLLEGSRFYLDNRNKNISTLCSLYGAEAANMLKLAQINPDSFQEACGEVKIPTKYVLYYRFSKNSTDPLDAMDIMLNPQGYERHNTPEELLASLAKPIEQMKAAAACEKPNIQIDSPIVDRSAEIPEAQRKEYINKIAEEYLKIKNAGSYDKKGELCAKKDALKKAQDLYKDYGSDTLKLMKLARHHPEEFRDTCGLVKTNGLWVEQKDRMEITPEDALYYMEEPFLYERNSSPAQLAAALQESINNPQKIADCSYSAETRAQVQVTIKHLDDAMEKQVIEEGKNLAEQLCEVYGDKAGIVATAYLDSLANDGDIDSDDLLDQPLRIAEELRLEGDPEKNSANYDKYDDDTIKPYSQATLDDVSGRIESFYKKNLESTKFSKETVDYLCETYGDKAPEILDEVIVNPRNTAQILGCYEPNTATIVDVVDRLCCSNPKVGDEIMQEAFVRQFSAEYLSSDNVEFSAHSSEVLTKVSKENIEPASKDTGIIDVNADQQTGAPLGNLTAENLTDPNIILNPMQWAQSLREATSGSLKNQATLVASANSSNINSNVSEAVDAFNTKVDASMTKSDKSTGEKSIDTTLAANVVVSER